MHRVESQLSKYLKADLNDIQLRACQEILEWLSMGIRSSIACCTGITAPPLHRSPCNRSCIFYGAREGLHLPIHRYWAHVPGAACQVRSSAFGTTFLRY